MVKVLLNVLTNTYDKLTYALMSFIFTFLYLSDGFIQRILQNNNNSQQYSQYIYAETEISTF